MSQILLLMDLLNFFHRLINMKIIEMILCITNFSFVFNPVFFLFLILKKSSKKPVIKKPKIVSNKSNNFREPKFIVITKRKIKKGIIKKF